jgi:hypothetical protein
MIPLSLLWINMDYPMYSLKYFIGETGCYIFHYLRYLGTFAFQLQSFFVATFRYICLLNEDLLFRFSLSPEVSIHIFFSFTAHTVQ